MKIFLIERKDGVDYDEYDSAVVVAETPEQALQLLKERHGGSVMSSCWKDYSVFINEVSVSKAEIILESFNAG